MESNTSRHRFFIGIFFLISLVLFLYLFWPFLMPFLMAMVFAILLLPFQNKLVVKLKGKQGLATTLIILLMIIVIILPTAFITTSIINESSVVAKSASQYFNSDSLSMAPIEHLIPSQFQGEFKKIEQDLPNQLGKVASNAPSILVSGISNLTASIGDFLLNMFIFLYSLAYFLSNANYVTRKLKEYLPFTSDEFDELVDQTMSITQATLSGAILIGIIQGAMVGLGFWATGLPAPFFWGAIASFCAILPSVGTTLIYLPAGLYLLYQGHTPQGIGMLIWGFGFISVIDNFLRPILVGKGSRMPDIFILISTLGGISMFGLIGVVVGPLIVGLFLAMLKIYHKALN